MSGMYGHSDDEESIATIHEALDAGVTLFDTGDFYGMGHNELLLGRALRGRRDRALISVKFGALRAPGGGWLGFDARPAALKNFLCYTLNRLGVDHIDIYRPARLDAAVPIEDTVGAIADLIKGGYVRAIGLSEVGAETIRKAHAVHPIADLQIEYSLLSRGPEQAIFPLLKTLGIGVTAYSVLSRGLLAGSQPKGPNDFRAHLPRFSGENAQRNAVLVAKLGELATASGLTPAQLATAWVMAQGENIVPLVGARTRVQLRESLRAAELAVAPGVLQELSTIFAPGVAAGERYQTEQMRHLDSERT